MKSSNDLLSRISDSSREFKTGQHHHHLRHVRRACPLYLDQLATIRDHSQLKDRLWRPAQRCWWIICSARSSADLFGGAMDVIKFMLKPDGGFMPGFTFNAMLAAFIYGLFFYKKNLSLPRILTAKLVVIVLCNIVLGTYWLTLYDQRKGIFSNSASPRHQEPDPVAGGLPDLRPGSQDPGAGRRIPAGPPPASTIKQAVRSSHGHPGSARIP